MKRSTLIIFIACLLVVCISVVLLYGKDLLVNISQNTCPESEAPFRPAKTVKSGNGYVVSDEILVQFKNGTSCDKILNIVKDVKGVLAGRIYGIDAWQVRFSGIGTFSSLDSARQLLKSHTEVESVDFNYVNTLDSPSF